MGGCPGVNQERRAKKTVEVVLESVREDICDFTKTHLRMPDEAAVTAKDAKDRLRKSLEVMMADTKKAAELHGQANPDPDESQRRLGELNGRPAPAAAATGTAPSGDHEAGRVLLGVGDIESGYHPPPTPAGSATNPPRRPAGPAR
jgi:hypothetical protein